MKRNVWWSFVVAGLMAGVISGGCSSKQVREEGAVAPAKASAPGVEQPARRGEPGPGELGKKEATGSPGDVARQAPEPKIPTPVPALPTPPPPPKTAALEPAPKTLAPGTGLSGETGVGLNRIHFAFDEAALTAESREILTKNAAHLKQAPAVRVRIEGHCDERGTAEYNLALGERRAQSAFRYLVDLGIAPGRMTSVTFGKEAPLDPRHNEEAWAKNRRAEFVELSK
jgi:peptidoglycan-associated lipoprotein